MLMGTIVRIGPSLIGLHTPEQPGIVLAATLEAALSALGGARDGALHLAVADLASLSTALNTSTAFAVGGVHGVPVTEGWLLVDVQQGTTLFVPTGDLPALQEWMARLR